MSAETYAVDAVTYGNGVVLLTKTPEGWPVIDTNGDRLLFATIPDFVAWCVEHYTWPMPNLIDNQRSEPMNERHTNDPQANADYRKAYNRGWASGQRGIGGLDRADDRGEPEAWYDGYLDAAAGREKWHLLNCSQHDNSANGCGRA